MPAACTVEPVACHASNKTTAEYIESPTKLYSLTETCDAQSLPPLQSGLMTDATVHPLRPSCKIPKLPNQPSNTKEVPLCNSSVLVSPQTDKAYRSGIPTLQKDITQNTLQLLHPPPGPLPDCQISPDQNAGQGLQFFCPSSVPPVVIQETVANSNSTFQANSHAHTIRNFYQGRKEHLLGVKNTVPLLPSYTYKTAHENSSSTIDSRFETNFHR